MSDDMDISQEQLPPRPPSVGWGENDEAIEEKKCQSYPVVGIIGSGKFSVVHRAQDLAHGRQVALKKIEIYDMDPKSRRDCLKEVALLQSVSHPNIIQYLDSWIEENILYIVLELAERGDLGKLINQVAQANSFFEEKTIWKYFEQICAALRHTHEKRIMHRDLKPGNIFMTGTPPNDLCKLGDLGLGRIFSSKTLQTFSWVGTPYYMSPEVIKMAEQGYGFKSDVWSLGCILYELACLKSPFYFEDANLYLLGKKINQLDYPPIPDGYSSELSDLVTKILQLDPNDRPDIQQIHDFAVTMCQRFQ